MFSAGYNLERAKAFHTQLLDRVREIPGVESATLSRLAPFSYGVFSSAPLEIDGYQPAPDEQLNISYNEVAEDYFKTLDIPIAAGREFQRTDDENALPVAIINETMAAKYWPGKDPIGQRFKLKDRWLQIAGVARNVNYENKLELPRSFFYVPVRQNFFVSNNLLVRTRATPGAIRTALAREVKTLDPNLAPTAPYRVQEQVDRKGYTQRLATTLVAIFGVMALFLAAIGLYAVMSYSVSQGTRELGLRMALGAGAADLLRMVVARGLRLTIAPINDRRNLHRRDRRAVPDTFDGQSPLQGQPARSDRLRIRLSRHDHGRVHSLFPSRPSRHPHRSGARVASVRKVTRVRGCFGAASE
ncbi:MAG: hypothetical protein DME70_08780 [Verrucomicrobia bacterium]|nr:MAG: hypothetical protein DME70_08780 [Verrucomicrobiota bacterium]